MSRRNLLSDTTKRYYDNSYLVAASTVADIAADTVAKLNTNRRKSSILAAATSVAASAADTVAKLDNKNSSLLAAVTAVAETASASADFEAKHPRAKSGEFTDKGKGEGGPGNTTADKDTKKKSTMDTTHHKEILGKNYDKVIGMIDDKTKSYEIEFNEKWEKQIPIKTRHSDIAHLISKELGLSGWGRDEDEMDGDALIYIGKKISELVADRYPTLASIQEHQGVPVHDPKRKRTPNVDTIHDKYPESNYRYRR